MILHIFVHDIDRLEKERVVRLVCLLGPVEGIPRWVRLRKPKQGGRKVAGFQEPVAAHPKRFEDRTPMAISLDHGHLP